MSADIAGNLRLVQERIQAAAQDAGRSTGDIQLVVVTKGHPADEIQQLLDLGISDVGESYLDEALSKQAAVADASLRWHMIGHVQSRKAPAVAGNFAMLHSLDSLKLARRLDRAAEVGGHSLPVLLEMNVSGEASKYGWPAATEAQFSQVLPQIEQVLELRNLSVHGLMCMAPLSTDPMNARPHFSRLRKLRDDLQTRFPAEDWTQLSMGMSDDFPAAILEGATILRIGTAIMGPRLV